MRFLWRGYKSAAVALFLVGLCVALSAPATPTVGLNGIPIESEWLPTEIESGPVLGHKLFLPFIFKNHAPTPPETLFGVQMYGSWVTNDNSLGLARVARVSWIRWPISWSQIEPVNVSPSQYSWAATDAAIAKVIASGHRPIITIGGNPSWAATYPQGPIDKVGLSEFAQFVGEFVERYDGDGVRDAPGSPVVQYWEFYNEPDGDNRWAAEQGYGGYWGRYGAQYAQMLCVAYQAVKASNPNAKVLLGGVAYDLFTDQGGSFHRAFLDDVFGAGGGSCFDFMNFHYYPSFEIHWLSYGYGIIGKYNHLQQKLQSYGLNKPLFITEAGWFSDQSSAGQSNHEIQSRYVVKLFTQAAAVNARSLIWFSWADPGAPYEAFGLLSAGDWNPKMAFWVYQIAAEKVGLSRFEQTYSAGTNMEGYRFTNANGKPLYVFWSRDGVARNVLVPGSQAQVVNMQGQLVRVARDGDDGVLDGRIRVAVDANPVYVEVDW